MDTFLLLSSCIIALVASTPLASNQSSRIINGSDAERYQFPYLVSLQNRARHTCGGGILTPTWIVTAAHCFSSPEDVAAVAGLLDQAEGHPHNQRVPVAKVVQHPDFTGGYDDIALLKLSAPFFFNRAVQPVKLPQADRAASGEATLAGWGRVVVNPETPAKRLQWLTMPIITNDECNRIFTEGPIGFVEIIDSMMCTLPKEVGQSACFGDSGGPLVQDGVVLGVVKGGGADCGFGADYRLPNAFTRIASFIDFIKTNVDDLSEQ